MPCGLFGKLPAKRDFVALNAPRRLLEVWEPWMQAGVATSRQMLGGDWQAAFGQAPIWRFWLGSAHCGSAVLGAFMPSVDAVGRYFPLTLFALPAAGASIPPPEIDGQEGWFHAVETLLLEALEMTAYEPLAAAVEALPLPAGDAPGAGEVGFVELDDGAMLLRTRDGGLGGALSVSLKVARSIAHERSYAHAVALWTVGGQDYAPAVIAHDRLPPPAGFAALLTGQFGPGR